MTLNDLNKLNIIGRMENKLMPKGGYYIDFDSKKITCQMRIPHYSPWVVIKQPEGQDCRQHHEILFGVFQEVLEQPPSFCQGCWKVVVRPENIQQLLQLANIQERIADQFWGCKCGIETRHYVEGAFGGYFYNKTKEDGLRCLEIVRAEVKEHLGDSVPVILKRACTEYEAKYGDSSEWYLSEEQLATEAAIGSFFDLPAFQTEQPMYVRMYIIQKWKEWSADAKMALANALGVTQSIAHCRRYESR